MPTQSSDFNIGIPVYDGVDLLDFAAPCEVFSWMAEIYDPKRTDGKRTRVRLIAAEDCAVTTRDGLRFHPDTVFATCPQLDVLWVPGGDPVRLAERMQDSVFLDFLRHQSRNAAYVTSVCEGALLLASAGLLDGYEATTHWAFLPCLKQFPKIWV